MKILVIGGTGWVGHNIVLELKKQGMDVTILSRGQKKNFTDSVSDIPCVYADKQDETAMAAILAKRYTHIIDTVPTPDAIRIIQKHAQGLHQYIHCSSTGGYAPLPFVPCNETAPYKGFPFQNGWVGKRIVDNLAQELFREQGFPATILRPCYITGPGILPLDNQGGRREDFIPDLIAENPLDLPDDGLSLLQPIHVQDLARAFVLAITHPRSIGQIYNICLDHAVTLNKYLELNAAVFGKKPYIHYIPLEEMVKKYGDSISELGLRFLATHMCFTNEKARRDLDFFPTHTPEEAIEETARWAACQQ